MHITPLSSKSSNVPNFYNYMQCAFFKRWCWFFLIERHVLSTWSMAKWSIFLGLLHFYPPHIMCFAHCLLEFQNQAMYLLSFIIVCNVHFLKDNIIIIIFYRKTCALHVTMAKCLIYKTLTSLPSSFFVLFLFFSLCLSPPPIDDYISWNFNLET